MEGPGHTVNIASLQQRRCRSISWSMDFGSFVKYLMNFCLNNHIILCKKVNKAPKKELDKTLGIVDLSGQLGLPQLQKVKKLSTFG